MGKSSNKSPSKAEQSSPAWRRCSQCQVKIALEDQHVLCLACRRCSESSPCLLDRHWTKPQWTKFRRSRAARLAKVIKPGPDGKAGKEGGSKAPASAADTKRRSAAPSTEVKVTGSSMNLDPKPNTNTSRRECLSGSMNDTSRRELLSGNSDHIEVEGKVPGQGNPIPVNKPAPGPDIELLPETIDPGAAGVLLAQKGSPFSVTGWVAGHAPATNINNTPSVVHTDSEISMRPPTSNTTIMDGIYRPPSSLSTMLNTDKTQVSQGATIMDGTARPLASQAPAAMGGVATQATGAYLSAAQTSKAGPWAYSDAPRPPAFKATTTMVGSARQLTGQASTSRYDMPWPANPANQATQGYEGLTVSAPGHTRDQGSLLTNKAWRSHQQLPPPGPAYFQPGGDTAVQPPSTSLTAVEELLDHPAVRAYKAMVARNAGDRAEVRAPVPHPADPPEPVRVPFPGPMPPQRSPQDSYEEPYEEDVDEEGYEEEEEYEEEEWEDQEGSLVSYETEALRHVATEAQPPNLPLGSFPPPALGGGMGMASEVPLTRGPVEAGPVEREQIQARSSSASIYLAGQLGASTSSPAAQSMAGASSAGSWVPPLERIGINYLGASTLGPYVARVLQSLGQRVVYDPATVPVASTGDLGFMNPGHHRRGPANPVPDVPLSRVVREIASEAMSQAIGREAAPRDPNVQRIAPISVHDRDLLSTPLCPESCFRLMEQDVHSRCTPVQPVPAGVEGEGQRKRLPSRKVAAWNREKDAELRKTEELARDGMQLANLQTYIMSHLLAALTDDSYVIDQADRVQTAETLKELQHLCTRQFSLIAAQSLVSRRSCAVDALNFPDRRTLMGAPIGVSLFGNRWEQLLEAEQTRRLENPPPRQRGKKRPRVSQPQAPSRGAPMGRGRGRGGRGRGRAPAALGAPPPSNQSLSVQQLANLGIFVQGMESAGPPAQRRGQGRGRGQRGSGRGRGNASRGRGQRRGGRGPPRGGSQPSA